MSRAVEEGRGCSVTPVASLFRAQLLRTPVHSELNVLCSICPVLQRSRSISVTSSHSSLSVRPDLVLKSTVLPGCRSSCLIKTRRCPSNWGKLKAGYGRRPQKRRGRLRIAHTRPYPTFTREARRQNDVERGPVPDVCLLDPDGDIVDRLRAADRAEPHLHWPGYHTTLYETELHGRSIGMLGRSVGASFAVLVAEQLFAAGCELLISVTSAGQIVPQGKPPYFVLIDEALRDEGTSYHYRPPSKYAALDSALREGLEGHFSSVPVPVHTGRAWTTDAPYRETETAIAAARDEGVLAVEMEAAALYAFAEAQEQPVVCFAHVTNQMAVEEGDFEKGRADGVQGALALTNVVVEGCEGLLS